MVVGCLELTLSIPAESLKEKRSVVKRVVERVKSRFHLSAAEVDLNDDHHRARIGIAVVTNDRSFANSTLDKVLDFVEDDMIGRAEVIDSRLEILNV